MCREAWSRALAEAQRAAVVSGEPDDASDGEPLLAGAGGAVVVSGSGSGTSA